ncbi:MAG: methyltransferase domain-containing protein, partial [Acidimicrobiia bacterium]|nr:methyltransferase domain-containing protein [Acidimicrobiia bacterium]
MTIPLDSIAEDRRPEALELGAAAVCQSCLAVGMAPFYEVLAVPVHSVTLLPTREDALAYPTADVLLGFCPACGFIQNLLYTPEVQDYSRDYEETQAFSPRFNEFAESLAGRLIDTHGLRDKDILEVGGGKGDFLTLLCEIGPNRGVGIDPAYVPGRLDSEALGRMTFHREFYGEDFTHLTGDLVCCRHTLEHVGPVREFTELLRQSAEHTPGSAVFLEVPDTLRVLQERAFWDIYYEHCSYFTLGSLARMAAGVGLAVTHLELGFDDQYLLLDATLGSEAGLQVDDLALLTSEVADFAASCGTEIDRWRSLLADQRADGKRAVLWGAGSKAVAFLNTLGTTEDIEYAVDINPFKHGTFLA